MFDKSNTCRYTYGAKKMIAETLVEWDEVKNQRNIEKHGISFETAALVFADEERIEYYDKLHSQEEDRYVIIIHQQRQYWMADLLFCAGAVVVYL